MRTRSIDRDRQLAIRPRGSPIGRTLLGGVLPPRLFHTRGFNHRAPNYGALVL